MARLVQRISRTLTVSSKTLIQFQRPQPSLCIQKPTFNSHSQCRTFVSDMRKSAFQDNILRLLRNEIQYELESSPPKQPVVKFKSFEVDERLGEQWIRLKKTFGDNEEIKVDSTMFDGSVPVLKSGSGVDTVGDVNLHITFTVDISKGQGDAVLQFVCSAWPDTIEIRKVFVRGRDQTLVQPYTGPEFNELDDELQESLYEFLETRGISDELAVFLHGYIRNKDKTELVRWLGTVKSFVEKK